MHMGHVVGFAWFSSYITNHAYLTFLKGFQIDLGSAQPVDSCKERFGSISVTAAVIEELFYLARCSKSPQRDWCIGENHQWLKKTFLYTNNNTYY